MKFSTALLTSLAALVAAAPIDCDDNKLVARDVVTVFAHETTYVYANADAAPAPSATPSPSPEVKAQAANNDNVVYQYVYVTVDQNGNLIQNTAVETKPAAAAPTQEAPKQEAPKPSPEAPKSSAPAFNANAGESAKVQTPAPKPSPAAPKPSPKSEAPASNSDSNLDSWSKQILDTQNAKRAEHGVGAFAWNETLANFAADYLNKAQCNFEHSGGPYGENLAMGYPSAAAAVNGWYDEVKDYNFAQGDFSMATGHFTQMVWKGSNQLGCAKRECGGNGAYVVCEYYPRGNIIGAFQQNVLN